MKIKSTLILDGSDCLSNALEELMESGTAVIVTKGKAYCGIIDDRNLRQGISDPSRVKCDNMCVRAPSLVPESSLEQKLNSFLTGHFKALPVLDAKNRPLGLYTRADLLAELLELKAMPKDFVRTLMSSPVLTVRHDETVGTAKKMMKEKNVNHLIVLRMGKPMGVVSTHDFTAYLVKPQAKQGKTFITETTNPNDMQVSNFMRDEVPNVSEDALLEDAMRKMAEGNFSYVLVLSGSTAKGILSATDIFKKVLRLSSSEPDLAISGLGDDDQKHYGYIKGALLGTIDKFAKSFSISGTNAHFKRGKSVYTARIHMLLDDREPISISSEGYSLKEAVDLLAKEIHNLLTKKKGRFVDERVHRKHKGEDVY